jgi:hypothetical protein
MEELVKKIKVMIYSCNDMTKDVPNNPILITKLMMAIFSMKEVMKEMATELIILREEVERNEKGEI